QPERASRDDAPSLLPALPEQLRGDRLVDARVEDDVQRRIQRGWRDPEDRQITDSRFRAGRRRVQVPGSDRVAQLRMLHFVSGSAGEQLTYLGRGRAMPGHGGKLAEHTGGRELRARA